MRFTVLVCFLLTVVTSFAQQKSFPKGYFRYPLAIPPKLNANFGEMRPNHFHMGLDLSTQRKENLPIYAAADGYVARLKIEPGGFGRAIYLNHPNGYTTLYAHMNDFMPELESWLKEKQYEKESWRIELFPEPEMFPVKKGQFIGYSGNTGGSQGPHVHFEIRETETEKCVNPLLFGFQIPDNVPPDLTRIAVFDRNQSLYEQNPLLFQLTKNAGSYQTSGVIKVKTDKVALSLQATDRMSGVPNANGIYEVAAFKDNQLIGGFTMKRVGYDETRYLNAHIDYKTRHGGGSYLQNIFPLDGDKLEIYRREELPYVLLSDTMAHQIRLEVKDPYGNTSVARFSIQRVMNGNPLSIRPGYLMKAGEVNVFENDHLQVFIPEDGLYDSIYFRNSAVISAVPLSFSPVHFIHTPSVPVHNAFTLRLKPDKAIPYHLRDRMLIRQTVKSSTVVSKAQWELGWYVAKFREFGAFQLVADDQPPVISFPGIADGASLAKAQRIVVVVNDNYNGIKNFRAELDGNWLMFAQKGRTFTYKFDEHCPPGQHILQISVEDEAGNQTIKEISFIR